MVRVHLRPLPRPAWLANPLRILLLAMFLASLAPVSALARQADSVSDPRGLLVTWQTADGETFRAVVTDAMSIERIVAALDGDGYAGIPIGVLAHGDGGINAPHAWHLLDVTVVDITIELCDGTASMVDADVDYWVDVVGRFCPWSAIVIAAEPLRSGPAPTSPPATEPVPTATPTIAATEALPGTGTGTATAAPTVALPTESPPANETQPGLPPAASVTATVSPSAGAIALPDTGSGIGEATSLFQRPLSAASEVMLLLLGTGVFVSWRGSRRRAGAGDPR